MPSPQLWRAVLSPSSLSADQQEGRPDADGSYGDLMDAIDDVLDGTLDDEASRGGS